MGDRAHLVEPRQTHPRARGRVLFVTNVEWYFLKHHLSLARALREWGLEVTVAAAVERGQGAAVSGEGFRFVPLRMKRHSYSLPDLLRAIAELHRLYRKEDPDLIHQVTIKPVICGSIASRLARAPAVLNTIPGLGYMFIGQDGKSRLRRRAAILAYRAALAGSGSLVIFQNPEDRSLFVQHRIVPPSRCRLIRGVGVDVNEFKPSADPATGGLPIVLMASRLLWSKGAGELIQATRLLKARGLRFRTVLVGEPDESNPDSLAESTLREWEKEGIAEWWGRRDDMPAVLREASVVVLPSYREGLPQVLAEAAAAGKPVVATDVPGCREVVRHGENGLLVPPRDPQATADAMARLLGDAALREEMGRRGREIAVREFSDEVVVRQTLEVYEELLGKL
jgi:glycosyltransferase involved in cell wall biosynthesis